MIEKKIVQKFCDEIQLIRKFKRRKECRGNTVCILFSIESFYLGSRFVFWVGKLFSERERNDQCEYRWIYLLQRKKWQFQVASIQRY